MSSNAFSCVAGWHLETLCYCQITQKTIGHLTLGRHSMLGRHSKSGISRSRRSFSDSAKRSSQYKPSNVRPAKEDTNVPPERLARRAREKLLDKDFFFDLLSSAATKRDAKAYLSRLESSRKASSPTSHARQPGTEPHIKAPTHGVNLGKFFGHGRAVEDRPVFRQFKGQNMEVYPEETVHVALVKVSNPQQWSDAEVAGVAHTLSQLARLSMIPCVVVDEMSPFQQPTIDSREVALRQADRLAEAIESHQGMGARRIDGLLSTSDESDTCRVFSRGMLVRPLRSGRIPVLVPVAYTETMQRAVMISADSVLVALTKELAGLNLNLPPTGNDKEVVAMVKDLQQQFSIDRVIILDPLGGIMTPGRGKLHTFVNLEQEYTSIARELGEIDVSSSQTSTLDSKSAVATCPEHRSLESNQEFKHGSMNNIQPPSVHLSDRAPRHLQNLKLLKAILSLLPPSSSGIITSPLEAANSSHVSQQIEQVSSVQTRRQKNPLIHNLLTDKPAQSSSLPPGRLGSLGDSSLTPVTSTFVKKGMPLTILPDPTVTPWTADNHGQPRITLHDPRIDLPRLVHLIEDSFSRKLDVEDYLNRVNSRIAGLIVAGEYEGGALLTWETPPEVTEDGSPESFARQVPYLDKFAVLKRSQGAGGVADIVFNAMVRGCFPNGVCWRSRRDNPVNKWYFERARGTWKLPDMNWTMFWTTPGIEMNSNLFRDYEGVCRGVKPSWADKKHIVD